MKKIICLSLLFILLLMITYSSFSVYAGDNFNVNVYKVAKPSKFSSAATQITGIILYVIRVVGASIAIISLMIIGIKYMYGSAGDKADYKKNLVIFTIGGIGMFSVSTIVGYIIKLSEKVSTT